MSARIEEPSAWRNVTEVRAFTPIDTSAMFRRAAAPDDTLSPVDQFISNTRAINRIYLGAIYDRAPMTQAETGSVGEPNAEGDTGIGAVAGADEAAADVDGPVGSATYPGDGVDVEADASGGERVDLAPTPERVEPELGALAVLGYMSAVESYFRALIRKLIEIDDQVRRLAEPLTVSFGAACHHTPTLLPEALMEHLSFAGEKTIVDAVRSLIGIKGNLPSDVTAVLKEFNAVCEIRHCCVHRFGRLGSKSAMTLGIRTHASLLEMPFSPTIDELQGVAAFLHTFVKTFNNFVYRSLVERIARDEVRGDERVYEWSWTGRWDDDEQRFKRYYDVFASAGDTPPSADVRTMYSSVSALVDRTRAERRARGPRPRPVGAADASG